MKKKNWNALLMSSVLCLLMLPLSSTAEESIASTHAVQIDPDQPFPSVMFSDILKSMSDQVMWEKGQLRFFERVRMTFLPSFQDPQHIAAYNPNTGAFLVSQLRDESGGLVSTVFWEARQDRFPYWTTTAVNNSDPAPLAPGAYTLTWYIDGTAYWSLPFEVSAGAAASAYDQPNSYLNGPWNDWAYIYVPNGNLSQAPTFNFFLRDESAKPGTWAEKNIEVNVFRDGELVAQHGQNNSSRQSAKPWWVAQELALRTPDDSGFLAAGDIVSDGDYTVVVSMNGEPYAEYGYSATGALPFSGRQDRDNADPLEYLEGAQDRFYIQRK